MISKEERAELRKLIEQAVVWPLPWEAHGDGYSDNLVFSANEAQEDYLAEFTGRHGCDLAVAAVNALPKALDALDAADERIKVLESEHRRALELIDIGLAETAKWQGHLERTEDRLNARIAALEAAAHYDAWLLSGDTGMSSKAIFHFMRTGAKGGWTPSDPSDLGRCLRLLERFPEWRERMPEMADCSPKWARMMPYWDVLEASLLREAGGLHTDGSAPETFQMMKAIERGNGPEGEK